MESLLGDTLRTKKGATVGTRAALKDARFVLVYCSAHWCPPCKLFTPELGSFVTAHAARLGIKTVFLSNDRDPASFTAYFATMAWDLALSPEDDAGPALMSRFGVRGIPALLLFTASGALVTARAREELSADPAGARFPWVWGGDALGRRVSLKGLVSRADLNGKGGVVEGAVEKTARFNVRLTLGGDVIAVKRECFDFVD